MNELKILGLTRLNVSYDLFHREFIKPDKVKNLLEASIKCGIPTSLNMVISKEQNFSSILSELGDSVIACDIRISPCLPVGRAQKNINETQYIKKFQYKDEFRCNYGKIFVIHYDGKVYPCCSQFIDEEGLCLGNAAEMTLIDIINKLENNKLLYLIRNKNLHDFCDCLPDSVKSELPDRFVNDCDFCANVIRKNNFKYFNNFVISSFKKD